MNKEKVMITLKHEKKERTIKLEEKLNRKREVVMNDAQDTKKYKETARGQTTYIHAATNS